MPLVRCRGCTLCPAPHLEQGSRRKAARKRPGQYTSRKLSAFEETLVNCVPCCHQSLLHCGIYVVPPYVSLCTPCTSVWMLPPLTSAFFLCVWLTAGPPKTALEASPTRRLHLCSRAARATKMMRMVRSREGPRGSKQDCEVPSKVKCKPLGGRVAQQDHLPIFLSRTARTVHFACFLSMCNERASKEGYCGVLLGASVLE